MVAVGKMQLGKDGLSENFLMSLENQFKNHLNVKISVLQSARESRSDVKKYANSMLEKLGPTYTARVIGFTIALKKWRKPQKKLKKK